jgi:stalled ribosome rescue protein Dom34
LAECLQTPREVHLVCEYLEDLFYLSVHLTFSQDIPFSDLRREEKRKDVMAMGKLTWIPFGFSNSGLVRIASNSSFVQA